MASEIKGIRDIEEEYGVRLTRKDTSDGSTAVLFDVQGKKYPTIRQNLIDDFIRWFKKRRGFRALLFYALIIGTFVMVAMDAPQLLVVGILAIPIYIFAEIAAHFIEKGRKRPILQLSVERMAVPVSLVLEPTGKEIKTLMYAPAITGWDMHYVYEEAISETAHPDGVTIPDSVTVPNIRNKRKMTIVEYKSPDGRFAKASPFRPGKSYFMLSAFDRLHASMDVEYEQFMDKLNEMEGLDAETVIRLKDRHEHMTEYITRLRTLANEQLDEVHKHSKKIRSIAKVSFKKHDFVAKLDKANDPLLKTYEERKIDSTSITRSDLVDLTNESESILEQGASLVNLLPKLKYLLRQEMRKADMKIREVDLDRVFAAMGEDMKQTGAAKSAVLLQEAQNAYQQPDEEDTS